MNISQSSQDYLEDPEFQSLLVSCLEALERGEEIDRGELLRRNPHYAALIDEFLADRESLERVADDFRSALTQPARPNGAQQRLDETIDSTPKLDGFAAGDRIRYIGEFEILEEIARGGMGIVFKARQQRLKRIVALKMILSGRLADDADVIRFQREAQAAAGLKHPGIVAVHEVGQYDGHHYFTMDFVSGRSLAEALREESLPTRRAAEIVKQAAEAIQFAHDQGTLHRDLKPANVLLDGNDEPRITDFGLAKVMQGDEETRSELTASGQILGTPSYMSPEQAAGKQQLVGPATDVYSLGAILYACLTGRAPFVAESPVDTLLLVVRKEPVSPRLLNPRVPVDLETICLKCLAKEPEKRYGSAQELADDLERFLDGRPVVARPIGPVSKAWRWCRRNPVVAALLCLVALSMACGTAVSTFFAIEENHRAAAEAEARQDADDARKAEADLRLEAVRLAGVAKAKQKQAEDAEHRAEDRRAEAEASQKLAEQRAEEIREQLYVAHMGQAQLAWEDDNVARMLQLLEYNRPAEGEPDLRGFEWHYLWRLAHSARLSIDTGKYAYDLACSPDGKLVASTNNHQVELWDATNGERVKVFDADVGSYGIVAFSPDGSLLAFGRNNVKVWHIASGELIHDFEGPDVKVTSLAFHPDGRRLAVGAGGQDESRQQRGEVWVLDLSTERALVKVEFPSVIQTIEFHPAGSFLACADSNWRIHYLEAGTGAEVKTWKSSLYTRALAFSPDGKRLAHGGNNRFVEVLDIHSGELVAAWRNLDGEVRSLAFHADGEHLIVGDTSGKVYLWNSKSREVVRFFRGHASAAIVAAPRPGIREVVSLEDHGVIKFWNLDAQQGQLLFPGSPHHLADVQFSPRGDWLACAEGVYWNKDRQVAVRLWITETGEPGPLLVGHDRNVFGIAFRGDGEQLASAGDDGKVVLWNLATAEPIRTYSGYGAGFHSVVFRGDGNQLAAGTSDGSVLVWDAETGEQLQQFTLHGLPVESLSWTTDGTYLAACDGPGFKVWRMPDAVEVASATQARTRMVAFDPDGTLLACSVGHDVQFYDTATWRRIAEMNAHANDVYGLAFSADGRRLASSSKTGTLKLWDVKTRQSLIVLTNDNSDIGFATPRPAISPDGKWIVAGRADGAVALWTTEPPLGPANEDLQYWKQRAALFAQRQQWNEAVDEYEKVLAGNEEGWTRLAAVECASMTGDEARYLEHARAALEYVAHHAGNEGSLMLCGRLTRAACLAPGAAADYGPSIEITRSAWQHHGKFSEGMALLFALHRAGDYQALLDAAEAVRPGGFAPHRGTWYLLRAIALYHLGRLAEANDAFDRGAKALDGSMPPIGRGRDLADTHLDWFVSALAAYREAAPLALKKLDAALMDDPDNVELLVHRGLLHRRWQRWAEASADFDRAVSLEPEEFMPHVHAAVTALLADNPMRYQHHCQQMEELISMPEFGEQAWQVGRVAGLLPDNFLDGDALDERVRSIAESHPRDWWRTIAVPAVLFRLGRHDEALEAVALSKARAGEWTQLAVTLLWEAMIQHQRGESEQAYELFSTASQLISERRQPRGLTANSAITAVEWIVLQREARRLIQPDEPDGDLPRAGEGTGTPVGEGQEKDTAVKTDHDRLQGTWSFESGIYDGEEIAADRLAKGYLRFTGDEVKSYMPPEPDAVDFGPRTSRFEIDPTKSPKSIDLIERRPDAPEDDDADERGLGIYAFDGDRLKLVFADPIGMPRPDRFAGRSPVEDDSQRPAWTFVVLKRKTGDNKPAEE